MKKHIFRNPIKEAIDTQGKRWVVEAIAAVIALAILSVIAFWVEMTICGIIAAVAVMFSSGFYACYFGIETEVTEEE